MWFKLVRQGIGGRTVQEAKRRMGSYEFSQWMVYEESSPSFPERGDVHAAQICAMLANVNRDSKKQSTPFKIEDMILKFGPVIPEKAEDVARKLWSWLSLRKDSQKKKKGK